MDQASADDLARELFDADLPNVTDVTLADGRTIRASLSREYVETDDIVGVRSVLLCASPDIEGVSQREPITVGDTTYAVAYIEPRGRALSAVVLTR